jgi:hypothetical protein
MVMSAHRVRPESSKRKCQSRGERNYGQLDLVGHGKEAEMRTLTRFVCLVAPLILLLVCAASAQGTEISGTISTTLTIFDDSELVGDVTCMVVDAPCVKFGAPDITLALNGFTITGRANPPTNCTSTTVFAPEDGIQVVGQHDVAVLGPGLVQKFRRFGIFLGASTKVQVMHVTSSDNCFSGIQVSGTTDSNIEENISVRNAGGSAGFSCGGT